MDNPGCSPALSRRRFLAGMAALPALGHIAAVPAFAHAPRVHAPYLDLEKYILPGNDDFPHERAAAEVAEALDRALHSGVLPVEGPLMGRSPFSDRYNSIAPDLQQAVFGEGNTLVQNGWKQWVDVLGEIRRAQFYPLASDVIRFEVASEKNGSLLYRVGHWKVRWERGRIVEFHSLEEHVASASKPYFRDVTGTVLGPVDSFQQQLAKGIPYWRSRLDPASGIDIYGSNGVAVGDIDGDGFDEVYVCQPGGLPNRLYKLSPDGVASDITDAWDVGILDDTSAALFVDLRNSKRQDLVVLRSTGPVLFVNEGKRFRLRTDAFQFATTPAGGFTGMAAADFDRDGRLDLYLCCYVYFKSEAQYTYASPYHDARNGPPNFLFRNNLNEDGSGFLVDCTSDTGMNENNDRFSFAPAWCDFDDDGWPDLYVANDFGRKNLYVNEKGYFHDKAGEAGVEDLGPGMSASWFDSNGDGKPDLFVANMWTAPGQRLIHDQNFIPARGALADAYDRHTKGNSLFENRGDGTFNETTAARHAAFGRWAWSSGGHDLDNDGRPELFVTCGMLTNSSTIDLGGFFWRQVVAHAPVTAAVSSEYENGWNALNQFVREDYSWNGREPNVLHVQRGDRYFDFSGVSGLDVAEDSRAFAVVDFDGDGRPDVILKSRMGPQVRVLQNTCAEFNQAILFVLKGSKSNRDAIGAKVEVDGHSKWLEAGSGFLSQHSKKMIFGLGGAATANRVRVTWPSGLIQEFSGLSAGHTYTLTEDSPGAESKPFRAHIDLESRPVNVDNELRLQDTWFLEPVPLPESFDGTRLLILTDGQQIQAPNGVASRVVDFKKESLDRRHYYEVFRRYLFDWRTSLTTPIAFLLNDNGAVVKVYAQVPLGAQCRRDIDALAQSPSQRALPFEGTYIKTPRRDLFKFGAAFLWAGYPERALPYLEKALLQNPANERVLVLVGQIHLQAGRLELAEKSFRRAVDANVNIAEAWSGLGDVSDARNDIAEALVSYEKALAIKPNLFSTLLNAGQTADKADRQATSEAWYRKAFEIDPKSAEAANGLGLAMAKQGHVEEGRGYFEKAIALRSDYSAAINNLGVLYLQQGQVNDAIAAFEYGIRVAPNEDILYLNLGRTYTRMGNTDKARQIMQNLLDRKPDSATALRALQELGSR